MDNQIRLRDLVQTRVTQKGRLAYFAGQSRDSHGMNPGAPAIVDFWTGYDEAASSAHHCNQSRMLAGSRVDARQGETV